MMNHGEPVGASGRAEAPSLLPVRAIACFTAATCIVAQLLSQMSGDAQDMRHGPFGVVLGQALWNASQVGLLFLLLCMHQAGERGWVTVLSVMSLVCLPFAIYVASPGGQAHTILLLAVCALTYARNVPDLCFAISDAPAPGTRRFAKFELLAFTCTLLCSLYNFNLSDNLFPYWASLFRKISAVAGFPAEQASVTHAMYTLGLSGVSIPNYIKIGTPVSSVGAAVFATIWSVLPFLYVLYFLSMMRLAAHSPGARVQRALCLFGIFHFLFLTDVVDYRFGRGILNAAEEWAHWAERFSWHIALLLPVYQKVTSGHWLRGNGILGLAVHYAVAAWAVGYLLRQVITRDVTLFYYFLIEAKAPDLKHLDFGLGEKLGYPAALVLTTLVYGFSLLTLRCKHMSIYKGRSDARSRQQHLLSA